MTLSIQHLVKQFGNHVAVNDISIDLPSGEVLGLLGRNGAGKSTTIKMMLNLLQPDDGSIQWNGKQLSKKHLSIGYLPEERGLYAKTKIAEQLKYFGELEGMDKRIINERIDYWLERFGIPEYKNKAAGELSKGNQQKIQIIGTLLHNPELIILDEPFSGLDPVNATLLSEVISEEIARKKTIILSSHRMEQIETFCENICMMKHGEIVVSGKLQDIKENYGYKNFTFTTKTDIHNILSELPLSFEQKGNVYSTQVTSDSQALEILNTLTNKGISFQNYAVVEPSLHQIFVERTR